MARSVNQTGKDSFGSLIQGLTQLTPQEVATAIKRRVKDKHEQSLVLIGVLNRWTSKKGDELRACF